MHYYEFSCSLVSCFTWKCYILIQPPVGSHSEDEASHVISNWLPQGLFNCIYIPTPSYNPVFVHIRNCIWCRLWRFSDVYKIFFCLRYAYMIKNPSRAPTKIADVVSQKANCKTSFHQMKWYDSAWVRMIPRKGEQVDHTTRSSRCDLKFMPNIPATFGVMLWQ